MPTRWRSSTTEIASASRVASASAGLVTRQPWAGPASAALLVAILPGNVQFALDRAAEPDASPAVVARAWLRLPLQLPMIWAALQARRRD